MYERLNLEHVYEKTMQIWEKKVVVESFKNEQNFITALKDTYLLELEIYLFILWMFLLHV